MHSHSTTPASSLESKAKPKVESEPDINSLKPSSQDLLTLPSNECSNLPKSSELSISDRPLKAALSGLAVSFGKTLPYLPRKTVTRRTWKDSHALKFTNAFNQNKLVQAFDKDRRYGVKQIGWCRLLCAPYKEQLSAMPAPDLQAEGGMCDSVEAFIHQYFKGNNNLEVWVIRFEFIAAGQQLQLPTVDTLGVCSDSANTTNSNSANTSSIESIHQAQLSDFYVGSDSVSKTNSISPLISSSKSIHQASLEPLGVYSAILNKTNSNSRLTLSTQSIHQASLEHHPSFSIRSAYSQQSNTKTTVYCTNKSRETASVSTSLEYQTALGVCSNNGNRVDANTAIPLPVDSIHQASIDSLGVYSDDANQSDSNYSIASTVQSIHQTLVVQGGSGLVYSFWKGESTVNHYRYKVKVNGKWKVKSIHIPAGKLLKVREAIANKSSVTAIVTEVLGGKL